jgi:hypothetical protein
MAQEKKWDRASFLVFLLPFFEQTAVYESIPDAIKKFQNDNPTQPPMVYRVINPKIAPFVCPTDPNMSKRVSEDPTWTNYRGCLGDLIVARNNSDQQAHYTRRSWLVDGRIEERGMGSIQDGTSNSIMLIEGLVHDGSQGLNSTGMFSPTGGDYRVRVAGRIPTYYNQRPDACLNLKGPNFQFLNPQQETLNGLDPWGNGHNLGQRAWDDFHHTVGIHTLLPPNSPSCHDDWRYALISASSMHTGGVNVAMHDCATRFVPETINTQNLDLAAFNNGSWDGPEDVVDSSGRQFSYGVWAELGAINSGRSTSL